MNYKEKLASYKKANYSPEDPRQDYTHEKVFIATTASERQKPRSVIKALLRFLPPR